MSTIPIFLEAGQKKTFAGALDYPGWCRSGRDEAAALQALLEYSARYAQVLKQGGIRFQPPGSIADFAVAERHPGNATTDFGAPAAALDADRNELQPGEFERLQAILLACWQAFQAGLRLAQGKALRKGPRGGGRDVDQILDHVIESEIAYLRSLGWNHKPAAGIAAADSLTQVRQAVLGAIAAARDGELPAQGPRGGKRWLLRYYLRRSAWHLLDHAWEIEDRLE